MTKKIQIILAVVLCAGLLTITTGSGCKSSPLNTAVKAEAVLITSVDTGMQIWAVQVKAGNATQNQVDTVKTAYTAYYNAQQLAKAALEKWAASGNANDQASSTIANAAVVNAQTSLLNILNQYVK